MINSIMSRMLLVVSSVLLVSGCAVNLLGGTSNSQNARVCMEHGVSASKSLFEVRVIEFRNKKKTVQPNAEALDELVNNYKVLLGDVQSLEQVDGFLDCYIGPDGGTLMTKTMGNPTKEELAKANELNLFRGHIITTLLARYGALNVSGQFGREKIKFSTYDGLDDDAEDIINSIRRAEMKLRIGSTISQNAALRVKLLPNDPSFQIPFPKEIKDDALALFEVDAKRDRVLAVSKLMIDVETPTYERGKNWILNLIGFVQMPTFSRGKSALKDAANGFKKLSVVSRFRDAYFKGIRIKLNNLKGNDVRYSDW